ncbi:uncharacterized protein LOC142355029 [Convolutriloba macropyga]|uniref:uncharacterized protein LOC142355029 n=1 Tax=Convolutriloba macropyga TaxID=536237 RepID=UPI003F520F33
MLLEQHEEVYIIPKEACGVSCIDAVLGIIRSNSACTQLQEWLPDETADLKPLLGKRYSRACADIWASKRAEEGSEAEKRACTVAWEACEFSLPQSSMQLTPTKVKSNLENDIYNNWSCPNSCNSTYLGQLTSQACASHLLTLSLGNSSSTGKHLLAEAIRAALLDKDKGVRRICELTVDPRDTEMVAVRFIARGLEASALPADERLREAYLRNAIANASGVLPRYVTVGTEADGRVLSLKLKGEVLLPAEQRLKLAVLDGRLMQNLASIFPEDRASAIAANAWLEELQIQPIRGWAEGEVIEVFFNSHSSASVGGALRTLALSAAVYLFAVGHGGGGL